MERPQVEEIQKLTKRHIEKINFRMPIHISNAINGKVITENKTKSKIIREALESYLELR